VRARLAACRASACRGAVAVALLAVAGLSACTLFEEELPPVCPDVVVLGDATRLTRFAEGGGRDLLDVDFDARIDNVSVGCELIEEDDETIMMVAVAPIVTVERGPANRDREARFDYFISVLDPQQAILNKQTFGIAVRFPGNRSRLTFRDDAPPVTVDLPLAGGRTPDVFELVVGFQLSAEELTFNRRRGGRP